MLRTFVLLSLVGSPVFAGVDVGDAAPKFQVKADDGSTWDSSKHFGDGSIYAVYFYPADMTGGCTKQACSFRDDSSALKKAGVTVIGVSGDSVKNHKLFKKAHDLNFTLLADEEGKAAEAFGVPYSKGPKSIERTIDGIDYTLTRGATIKRWTFVVGPDGKIAMVNPQVKAADDSKAVLAAVKKLKK